MATNCTIALLTPDDTKRYITCFYDGYPEHAGRILLEHYSHEAQLTELLAKGNIEMMAAELGDIEQDIHGYRAAIESADIAAPYQFDYHYLLNNGEWFCNGQPLATVIKHRAR